MGGNNLRSAWRGWVPVVQCAQQTEGAGAWSQEGAVQTQERVGSGKRLWAGGQR